MIAKLPTLPPSAAPRTQQSQTPADSRQPKSNSITFDQTLFNRQKAQRQRDSAADSPVIEKPTQTKADRAARSQTSTKETSKTSEKSGDLIDGVKEGSPETLDAVPVSEGDVIGDAAAPVGEAEPVTGDDEVAVEIEQVAEDIADEDVSEAAQVLAAVQQVTSELLQQVTSAIASPTDASADGAAGVAQVATNESATAAPLVAPKKNEKGPAAAQQVAAQIQGAENSDAPANEADADGAAIVAVQGAGKQDSSAESALTGRAGYESSPAGGIALEKPMPKSALSSTEASSLSAISTSSPQPGSAAAGESLSAQFAQLPQGDDAAVRDEVNMGRLTRGLSSAINQRGGSVTLRLTPPDLGLVRIDMAVRDGVVSAKFTAQSESVRNLLMDQMGQLRQALDRQGLSVDKIEVQVTQPSASTDFDQRSQDTRRDGRSAGQYHARDGQRESSKQSARRSDRDTFDSVLQGASTN